MSLLEGLAQRIAILHGVAISEVTPEFVREKRQELYANPDHRFVDDREWLTVQTLSQIEAQAVAAQTFLAEMVKK